MATSGRPGPVVVSLRGAGPVFNPGHVVEAEPVSEPEWGVFPARRALPDPQSIDRAVELLRGAERPCIIAGGGVTLSQAWDELRELAELGQIPVAHTISGKGAFPERHPLSAGTTGGFAGMSGPLGRAAIAEKVVHDSDVVLLVGTRTNEMATNRWTVPQPRRDDHPSRRRPGGDWPQLPHRRWRRRRREGGPARSRGRAAGRLLRAAPLGR